MGVPPVKTTLELVAMQPYEQRRLSPRFPTQAEADARLRSRRKQIVGWALCAGLIVVLVYLITGT
jgi:hypothetical protein